MKVAPLFGISCALFAAPALVPDPMLAQSLGEKSGINTIIGVAPKTQDFVTIAAVSDMFEIESSKLATQRGDASSKAFATKMIADHTQTSNELKSLVSSGQDKAELPTEMDSTHRSKLERLQGLNGAAFDAQYDSDQLSAHKDAVSLFERYAKGGEDASLKAFAAKTLPHLQEHLKMAEDLGRQAPTTGSK
jgi:putative membrane protein